MTTHTLENLTKLLMQCHKHIGVVPQGINGAVEITTLLDAIDALATIAAASAVQAKPVAWADDNAIEGKVGNCCSTAAKRYWETSSDWVDKKRADLHKHPLYASPQAPTAQPISINQAVGRVNETDDFAAEVAWILNPLPPGTLLYEGPQISFAPTAPTAQPADKALLQQALYAKLFCI